MEMDYEMSADSATTMKFSKGEGKDPQILLPKQVWQANAYYIDA